MSCMLNLCCFHLPCRSICVDVGHWWWEPVLSDRFVTCLNSSWFVKMAVIMLRNFVSINLCWIVYYYVKFVKVQIARDVEVPLSCCPHDSLCSADLDSQGCPCLKPCLWNSFAHETFSFFSLHLIFLDGQISFHQHLYLVIIVNVRFLAVGLCHGMCALWLLLFNSWWPHW